VTPEADLQYRTLGRTNIRISVISFGAGPVSTLMVGQDADAQSAVAGRAVAKGINWFDTAATYGEGRSEDNLGRALAAVPGGGEVHVATKVRFLGDDLSDIRTTVRRSFDRSLKRLQRSSVTLLQLHNSITAARGDEPTSITPQDVLGPGGVLDAFRELQQEGLVRHIGLTGIGSPAAMAEVVRSGEFDTMQVPYHLLNASAGRDMAADCPETNYGNIIGECAKVGMGVMAIRVLAGGALADNPPSPHTLKTPFFPLALYERDRERAARLRAELAPGSSLPREAIRFALSHPQVHSAIIGFAEPSEIDEALESW
jgi:aryl-alcohol dehydrogenase-like predicted oxidoreductase